MPVLRISNEHALGMAAIVRKFAKYGFFGIDIRDSRSDQLNVLYEYCGYLDLYKKVAQPPLYFFGKSRSL